MEIINRREGRHKNCSAVEIWSPQLDGHLYLSKVMETAHDLWHPVLLKDFLYVVLRPVFDQRVFTMLRISVGSWELAAKLQVKSRQVVKRKSLLTFLSEGSLHLLRDKTVSVLCPMGRQQPSLLTNCWLLILTFPRFGGRLG